MIDPQRSREILSALGIDILGEQGDELMALCPMHRARTGREDHRPSWFFNASSGKHICFSCGYQGGVRMLVVDLLDLHTSWGLEDWDAADAWLESYSLDLPDLVKRMSVHDEFSSLPAPVPMSEARLAVFTDPPQWALDKRQLTLESCHAYGILWDPKKDAWITPFRDPETRKLIGYQSKEQLTKKFRNHPVGVQKSNTLFGIDAFPGGRMIVVESPLDTARIFSAGITGAVATCGWKVSDEQVELMMRADELILAMDNPRVDTAGEKALEYFFKLSRRKGFDFRQFSYGRTSLKDPGDMSDREINMGVDRSVHCIRGLDLLKNA